MIKTLADYIQQVMKELDTLQEPKQEIVEFTFNDYEVFPEDDGYDRPRNAYSRV